MHRLDSAIEGSPRTGFFLELFGNSAIFPIANAVLELLLEDGFGYFKDPDFYALMLGAIVQARFLCRRNGARLLLAGNLVGPAVYTAIETSLEGARFFDAPHHLAYWAFAFAIGILQQSRAFSPPRLANVLLVVEAVVRSSILFAMYAIYEVLSTPAAERAAKPFFEDSSHVFIAWAVALLGLVAGLSALTGERYLAMLRAVSRQLRVYSEWFFGRPLLEQAMGDPARLALARRDRAIVFMDVRGFTRWAESQSPETVVAVLNAYYLAAEAAFERHVPVRFKFNADEVMAVFADPAQAVAAARELSAAAAQALSAHGLGAGIGVHCGPVIEGVMGAREVKAYDVLGDTVNTAKRIEGAAQAGEILLSDAVAVRIRHAGEGTRTIEAKGKSAPIRVHSLAGARPDHLDSGQSRINAGLGNLIS